MNIEELVAAVIEETSRPDLTNLIERRVKSTIIKMHNADFFPKDRVEEIIKVIEPNSTVKMNLPPRWRKFHTVRPTTLLGIPVDKAFILRDPGDIFTPSGLQETGIYYVAGAAFVMLAAKGFEAIYSMYYVYPDLSNELATTWITDTYDQGVIDGAASHIYAKVGYRELAREHTQLFNIVMSEIIQNHLIEGGL